MRLAAILLLAAAPVMAQDAVPDTSSGGDARSAIERWVVEFNLCSPLGIEVGGFSFGTDRTRSATISQSQATIDGDGMRYTLDSRLVCEASGAPDSDILAADINVMVEGLLTECRVTASEINLRNIEGDMAWALDAASPIVEGVLTARVEEEAVALCERLAS